jgi:hypothetical protein
VWALRSAGMPQASPAGSSLGPVAERRIFPDLRESM